MIYYERDRFGESNPIVIEEWSDLSYPHLHFHGHFEFLCLYKGQLKITLDNSEFILNAGQFLLIFPNQIHAFTSLGNAHTRVCIFTPSLVNTFYQAHQNMVPQKPVVDYPENIAAFINANLTLQSNLYMKKSILYAICAEVANQTVFVPGESPTNTLLIHQIISYISQNFTENISLYTASKKLGYNYQYLSNQLQNSNLSFSALLNQYRLDYSKYLLKHTDISITDIASKCGYNNIRTFNRNFLKAFQVTPRAYKNS